MEFFTLDLLQKINSVITLDETQRLDEIWDKNLNKYWEIFNNTCGQLPKTLVKNFKSGYFHDANIESLRLNKVETKRRPRFDFILRLRSEIFYGDMIHYGVTNISCSMKSLSYYPLSGEYLYGEILKNAAGYWTHNFLAFDGDEIFVECKKLKWVKLKNDMTPDNL